LEKPVIQIANTRKAPCVSAGKWKTAPKKKTLHGNVRAGNFSCALKTLGLVSSSEYLNGWELHRMNADDGCRRQFGVSTPQNDQWVCPNALFFVCLQQGSPTFLKLRATSGPDSCEGLPV